MDTEFDVRILGGTAAAEAILGKRPANWTVHEFGTIPPNEFLKEIDFWVYFHHPNTLEAYGRAVMEALYQGCVAILPKYMEESFGEAAIYCQPRDVRHIVRQYAGNLQLFLDQSAKGQAFSQKLGPELHTQRLREYSVTAGATPLASKPVVQAAAQSERERHRTLFITSNGAGMGHLTRTLAVARALKRKGAESIFFSLSQGVPVARQLGFPFEYMGSSASMQMTSKAWNSYFARRFSDVLTRVKPDTIVFDGTVPYAGLIEVLRETAATRVWIRRGMWKESSSAKSLKREDGFDHVIEPGEYAHEYDFGPTKQRPGSAVVPPVTLLAPEETLPRADARAALDIPEESGAVLLTLGAGNINSVEGIQQTVLDYFHNEHSDWTVYLTRPPISESIGKSSLNVLNTYPLARIANAFDFAVSAAGYNSFHEWISMGIPTLWIPNHATSIDDQLGRARWSHEAGTGRALLSDSNDHDEMKKSIWSLLDDMINPTSRAEMREQMSKLVRPQGADAIAEVILKGRSR